MKKIEKMQNIINELQKKKSFLFSEDMSFINFIKYKNSYNKYNKLSDKINKLYELKNQEEQIYLKNINKWINDSSIKCIKYSRLEKKAKYKLDKKLFKLGFYEYHPLVYKLRENIYFQKFISKISKFKIFSKIKNKSYNFISKKLSTKFNNIAINITKKCIKGYNHCKKNYVSYKKYLSNNDFYKYLVVIKNEAIKQLENQNERSLVGISKNNNQPNKKEYYELTERALHKKYVDSLRVNNITVENYKSNNEKKIMNEIKPITVTSRTM